MALLKCPLEGWILCAQKAKTRPPPPPHPPETTKLKFPEVSQSGLSNKYYLITPNFCAKFQPIG